MANCTVPPVPPTPWLGSAIPTKAHATNPLGGGSAVPTAGCGCDGGCGCGSGCAGEQPSALVLGNQCDQASSCQCGGSGRYAPESDANGGPRALERAMLEWSLAKAKTRPYVQERT